MPIAIHYSSVQLTAGAREVFGLQVAITHLLKAWFRYSRQDTFYALVGAKQDWDEIQSLAAEVGLDPARLKGLDRRYPRENFAQFDTIVRADPDSMKLLWQRQMVPAPGFSLCTLAHAISGIEAGEVLEQYCLAPSDAHDAIICPSYAVKSAIGAFWDMYGDYLGQRFGANYRCPVQLPVIPLGIDVTAFEQKATPDKRKAQRQVLGLSEDDIVLLWVGRLSYAIKAHPLAMYQAAERAAELTGKNVHLVMVGYFTPVESEAQFKELAAAICVNARIHFIARNDPRFPDGLWAIGDIFLSLVDNMQESFGLTPLEAMAAGLPRVVSDWDGYRDSVTDGVDGFLIPTTQPPPGQGRSLSEMVLSGREVYGGFLGKSAMCVAVDAQKAAEVITLLIKEPERRRMIAQAALHRVRTLYDWRHIIPRYENLWSELAVQRRASGPVKRLSTLLPQAPDPFSMYAGYPASALKESDRLSLIATTEQIKLLWGHEINMFAVDVLLQPEQTAQIIKYAALNADATVGHVLRAFTAIDTASLWRTIGWLIKMGIFGVKSN
jgi:glycosyltransferase involved in cell wall biosynthesis